MKVLVLHGRGSNNTITQFKMAPIERALNDWDFEYIQGTVPYDVGNIATVKEEYLSEPLYSYYDDLDLPSVIAAEDDLLSLIATEGPFDGVIGYSSGCQMASQLIFRDARSHPHALPSERLFKWAVFFGGVVGWDVFSLSDPGRDPLPYHGPDVLSQLNLQLDVAVKVSRLRAGKGEVADQAVEDLDALAMMQKYHPAQLADGRPFVCCEGFGLARYDGEVQGPLCDIPTLHVRDPRDEKILGEDLLRCCDADKAREFHHGFGHDFPRGATLLANIAKRMRALAESSLEL